MNTVLPRDQVEEFGEQGGLLPDVVVIDPNEPAVFPNGRAFNEARAIPGSTNNVPFLENFPFAAPPN